MWRTPELRLPMLLVAAIGTMTFNYPVILPLFATRDLASGAGTYTLLLSVMSIGSVAGSLLVARRTDITYRLLAVGAMALAASCFALASTPGADVAELGWEQRHVGQQ